MFLHCFFHIIAKLLDFSLKIFGSVIFSSTERTTYCKCYDLFKSGSFYKLFKLLSRQGTRLNLKVF